NWGGTRPGCWLHVVPAGGLVLSPESSSGCTCAYPIQTTLALAPMDRKENWSAFCTPGEAKPVKRQAINLGAPGDRRDAQGRLWLSFPRPPFRSAIQVPMRNEFLPGMGYFHRNSELLEVTGADAPWVFTSGACGLTRTTVELASAGQPPASYTVRLCFAELTHNQPGQRVFDVKIQGNVVLKDLDIFHQAAGRGKALVKEFKGVAVSDVLTIELLPKSPAPSADEAPLLCGLEVVRD
ncbi:MAG: hypothetical protein FJ272_12120, partial [Planctomycetes bacterium]|nr:hypothetical protein [Planctomycetota bacterium]